MRVRGIQVAALAWVTICEAAWAQETAAQHRTTVGLLAGPALYLGGHQGGGAGVETTGFVHIGNTHGLVVGLRLGGFLLAQNVAQSSPQLPSSLMLEKQVAMDVGYSTRFEIAGGNAGFFFLVAPVGSFYSSSTHALLGLTAGMRLQIGSVFELHIPVRYLTAFESMGARWQASLLAGVSF